MRRPIQWVTAAMMAAVFAQSAIAAPCGTQNSRVARNIGEARSKSMFAFGYVPAEGTAGNFKDKAGTPLQFVGNAFLIDVVEEGKNDRGYFATAKHNLLAACQSVADGSSPNVRLVALSGAPVIIDGLDASRCAPILETYKNAGVQDVVFDPDLAIVSGILPPGGWRPLLIGTDGVSAPTGTVEHMDQRLTPLPAWAVGAPTPPVQKAEFANFRWLYAVAGNNPAGASGSAYVSTVDGTRPIVLGVLTNSIPPTGARLVNKNYTLTADETSILIGKMYPGLLASSYSLLASLDVVGGEYDLRSTAGNVATLFDDAAADEFRDSEMALRLNQKISSGTFAALAYMRQKCEDISPDNISIMRYQFCRLVLDDTSNTQCYFDMTAYGQKYYDVILDAAKNSQFPEQGAAIKAANDARRILKQAGPSPDAATAGTVAAVLQAARDHPREGATLVNPRWDSAVIFDQAKAERASSGEDQAYLERLKEALAADPNNKHAMRAFVDATARSKLPAFVPDATRYLETLRKSGDFPVNIGSETAAALARVTAN